MAKAVKKTTKKVAKKAAQKVAPKKATKSAQKSTKSSSRRPNAAFMTPLTPSSELAVIVGNKPIPRTEIVKKTWDYIKKNGLQDKNNKRMINTDSKLKPVFDGKDQISMFEIAKGVNNHVK